jgi:hypothetical protein
MWCSSCYNHVSLINNVYPSQPGETGAKANNLSFLVFYAESRPQKLTKIGAYLEKRTARDISYSKIENLKVTLTILTVLVGSKCKENLDLFLVSVVNILAKMLESPLNTEIIEQISSTIISFSAHHNHVILDVDSAFVVPYLKILKILCQNVQESNEDPEIQNKKKISSVRALYAIVSNDTFLKSPKIDEFLEHVIPALLANIQEKKTTGVKLYRSLSNTDISDVDMDNLAIQSINEIMQRINPVTFDKVFNPIYKYLESNNHMLNKNYLLKLFKIFTKGMNPQYRYLLVLYSLKHLKDYSHDLAVQTNIIYILSNIIKNGGGAVVTHIEVLDVLSDCLFETLQNSSKYSPKDIESLENAYIDCINSFTSNVFYPEQMNDIMAFLVNHLKLNTSSNEVIIKCRIFIIRSLRFILEQRASFIEKNPTFNSPLPIELFNPTIVILKDSSFNLRLQYYFFLLLLMDQINTSTALQEDNKAHIARYRFMQNIHTVLFDYAQKKLNQPVDYIMIVNIFIKNAQVFGLNDVVESVPLMFELENISKVKFKNKDDLMLQYAINTMIVEFFDYLSEFLGNESLGNYIGKIKQNKLENDEWCNVSFTTAVVSQWLNKTFNDVEWKNDEFKESSVYLDHEYIISILCDHEELKEQFENLQELLNTKYTPKAFMSLIKDDYNMNKRMSSFSMYSMKDLRLVRNSLPPQTFNRDMTHASIHIEDLKEVLGSYEPSETMQNNDGILNIDKEEDDFKLTDEVNGLLDEITNQSRMTNEIKNSSTTLINQPVISSYENIFNSPKRKSAVTTQEEYPLTSMDNSILYAQDSFINNEYSLHY